MPTTSGTDIKLSFNENLQTFDITTIQNIFTIKVNGETLPAGSYSLSKEGQNTLKFSLTATKILPK